MRAWLAKWWQRLWSRAAPRPALPPPSDQPQTLGNSDEVFLTQLVIDLGDGRRRDEIKDPNVLAAIDALWQSGHERLAIEWLEKLLGVPELLPSSTMALRSSVVERYEQRGELGSALDHLSVLTTDESHALRAHYLLAEHARRREDHTTALRHYEFVLARDVDYPNVRTRVERLRQKTGGFASSEGDTITSGDLSSVSSGARYQLVRELGRGATGVVYLAYDAELTRDVAIKLLHPHLAGLDNKDALMRFFHEARVMASLRHPNVVAVLDLDEASRRIVMELAGGGTLRDVIRDRGPRPLRRAIERHGQIMSALAAAHRRGIIHCDLKPANLMFRRDADQPGVEVMLGDFGVAHLPSANAARSERHEAVGTLAYMAPEQRRGEVSPASDLYASGVVFYEMLTGRIPWSREAAIAGKRHPDDFLIPREIFEAAPSVGDAVQKHLDRLADPDPERRPTTAEALVEAQRLRERIVASGAA